MGTGYTRQDSGNNIADQEVIDPDVLDNEFDALVASFNSSTGHTHDGTSAEGAPITKMGPAQELVVSSTNVNPKTTATLDLGTSLLKFKDAHLSGTAYLTKSTVNEIQSKAALGTSVAASGLTPSLDCATGDVFTLTTAGSTTFTFDYSSVTLTTDETYMMAVILTAGGTHAVAWPAAVIWPEGSTPDVPASGETDVLLFLTIDGGTTWYGARMGQAFA